MNKKLLTILCLGLSFSLTACGGKPSSSANTDTGTDTGTTNTDTGTNTDTTDPVPEDRSDIEALYNAFGENNGVIDVIDYCTTYCFGSKAYYCDYGDVGGYGYIVNGTQGTYEFEVTDDEFIYGNILDRSTNGSAITSEVYTLLDLWSIGDKVWKQVEPGKYTTNNVDVLDVIGFIDGWGDFVGEYIDNPTLTITEGQAIFTGYLDLTSYFGYDDFNEDMSITFKDLGNAHNPLIEDKINNPVEQLGLSVGYDEELAALIDEYVGDTLPDLGFSKESYYEVNEDYGTLDFYDYSSDAASYSRAVFLLLSDGFELDIENSIQASGIDENGDFIPFEGEDPDEVPYYGQIEGAREYYNDNGDVYAIATVEAVYISPAMVSDLNGVAGLDAYPDGIVSYSFSYQKYSTYSEVCNSLSELSFPDNFVLDSFGFTAPMELFSVENMDDYGWLYGCDTYLRIYNSSFGDAEVAAEQLVVAETYLNSLGLITYEGYSANDVIDGTAEYMVLDKVFSDDSILELQFSIDEDGGIGIALMY